MDSEILDDIDFDLDKKVNYRRLLYLVLLVSVVHIIVDYFAWVLYDNITLVESEQLIYNAIVMILQVVVLPYIIVRWAINILHNQRKYVVISVITSILFLGLFLGNVVIDFLHYSIAEHRAFIDRILFCLFMSLISIVFSNLYYNILERKRLLFSILIVVFVCGFLVYGISLGLKVASQLQ